MVLEVIQKEVPARGIGYLILRDCPEERLGEALGRGMEKLKKAGAKQVLATSLPDGEPLHPGPVGVWRLTHVHDMVTMSCPLGPDRPRTEDRLALRPVKKLQDEKTYLELANRAFRNVPNARTYGPTDLKVQNHRCGLALRGDQVVGAYELDLTEKTPRLDTLAIDPELWRQGLGRTLLFTVLDGLPRVPACDLTVSSVNLPAITLYESAGFVRTGVLSSWFEVV